MSQLTYGCHPSNQALSPFLQQAIDEYFDTNYLVFYSVVIAGSLLCKDTKSTKGLLLVGAMAGDALLVSIVKRMEIVTSPTTRLC